MFAIEKLKRLSQVHFTSGIHLLEPAQETGGHCPLHAAINAAVRISGLSTLVVGTPECGVYSHGVANGRSDGEALHYNYTLDGNEVVFGCREGLEIALREMAAEGARAVAVISTCVPELIGEDYESVCARLSEEIAIPLLPVRVPHFTGISPTSGSEKVMAETVRLMKPSQAQRRVNILSAGGRGGSPEVTELRFDGLKVWNYTQAESIDDFADAPSAMLNIVADAAGLALAKEMEAQFGVPYISLYDAYGEADIARVYAEICEKTGAQVTEEAEALAPKLRELEARAMGALSGLTFSLTQPGAASVHLSAYLCGFGMKPVSISMESFRSEDEKAADGVLEAGSDPYIFFQANRRDPREAFEASLYPSTGDGGRGGRGGPGGRGPGGQGPGGNRRGGGFRQGEETQGAGLAPDSSIRGPRGNGGGYAERGSQGSGGYEGRGPRESGAFEGRGSRGYSGSVEAGADASRGSRGSDAYEGRGPRGSEGRGSRGYSGSVEAGANAGRGSRGFGQGAQQGGDAAMPDRFMGRGRGGQGGPPQMGQSLGYARSVEVLEALLREVN